MSGFEEDFSGENLEEWEIIPGKGRYSLKDNSGHLRYYLEGPKAYSGGWRKGYEERDWTPSLTLIRGFEGTGWTLRAKVAYNIRACKDVDTPVRGSTGAQFQVLYIAFGDGFDDYLRVERGTDWWYGVNRLTAKLVGRGAEIADCEFLAPDDEVRQEPDGGWVRRSYWYEVLREGTEVSFHYSYDGVSYTTGFKADLGDVDSAARVIIDASVWTTAGSYVDWDYINVEPSGGVGDLPVAAVEGIGTAYGDALVERGIKRVADLALIEMGEVPSIASDVGIKSSLLYVWKRRAELALSVRVDPAFESLRGLSVGDVIDSPIEELLSKTHQSVDAVFCLKRGIATLLCSLDNAVVRRMRIGELM
jgi:hypothetical protein